MRTLQLGFLAMLIAGCSEGFTVASTEGDGSSPASTTTSTGGIGGSGGEPGVGGKGGAMDGPGGSSSSESSWGSGGQGQGGSGGAVGAGGQGGSGGGTVVVDVEGQSVEIPDEGIVAVWYLPIGMQNPNKYEGIIGKADQPTELDIEDLYMASAVTSETITMAFGSVESLTDLTFRIHNYIDSAGTMFSSYLCDAVTDANPKCRGNIHLFKDGVFVSVGMHPPTGSWSYVTDEDNRLAFKCTDCS